MSASKPKMVAAGMRIFILMALQFHRLALTVPRSRLALSMAAVCRSRSWVLRYLHQLAATEQCP